MSGIVAKISEVTKTRSVQICVGLALLPYLLFARVTLGLQTFYLHDLQYYFYPYRKVAADLMWSGQLPLWNPYTSSGMPLWGDGQVGLLFPPNWLFFLMPGPWAMSMGILANFSIAGVGMFVLGRELGRSRLAATLGATAFMFSGYFVGHLVHPSIAATGALFPWVLWAFHRLTHRPTVSAAIVAGLFVATQIFAGHPQLPIYTGMVLLLLAAFLSFQRRDFQPFKHLVTMYAIGLGLSAVVLLPWMETMRYSPRGATVSFELFNSYSMHRRDWLMFFFPYLYGGPQTSPLQSATDIPLLTLTYGWERLPYVGLLTLVFAFRGMFLWRSSPPVRWVTVLLVVMTLIAAGGETPMGRLIYHTPLLGKLRGQARVLCIPMAFLCVLAMYGFEEMLSRARAGHRERVAPVAAGVLAILMGIGGVAVSRSSASEVYLRGVNLGVPLAVAVAGVFVVIIVTRGQWRAWKGYLILGTVLADVAAVAVTYSPTMSPATFARTPGVVEFLRHDSEPSRVAMFTHELYVPLEVAQSQLAVSWAMPYGVEDINGFNSLQPKRLVQLLLYGRKDPFDILYGVTPPNYFASPWRNALTLLGVRYAVLQRIGEWTVPPEWQVVYEDNYVAVVKNPDEPRRAFFASGVTWGDSEDEALSRILSPAFDPRSQAIVESEPVPVEPGVDSDELRRSAWSANSQTWEVRTSGPRLMVLSEPFWPGWWAEYQGDGGGWRELPIRRTNYLLRGVVVPGGKGTVRFIYRPLSVVIGCTVSSIMLLGCGILLRRQFFHTVSTPSVDES